MPEEIPTARTEIFTLARSGENVMSDFQRAGRIKKKMRLDLLFCRLHIHRLHVADTQLGVFLPGDRQILQDQQHRISTARKTMR